ncbi:MAG: division/cell wall cluster transcriptional repressor MraZ [Desulfovibrio sp.]|nr:division/cell wall cluster transcriptional repressor MraZ [Desulfovibrio sp.]
MQGFLCTQMRSLDIKGRLILPPEYREYMVAQIPAGQEIGVWATCFYGRLTAYLPADWEQIMTSLCKVPFSNVKLSHFKSKIIGLAQFLVPDAQGRVRIPQPLMHAGGLTKDVMILGMMNKFEIWDQARFDAIDTSENMAEDLAGLDIAL